MAAKDFKLTLDIEGYSADAVHEALRQVNNLCGEHGETSSLKAKVVIDSDDEQAVLAIREQFEMFLRMNKTQVDGTVTLKAPVVRKQPQATPMDDLLGDVGDFLGTK